MQDSPIINETQHLLFAFPFLLHLEIGAVDLLRTRDMPIFIQLTHLHSSDTTGCVAAIVVS